MRLAVSRAPGAEREVSPLELFFDLVYVFAIGQLSHHLVEHVDLRTGAETAIMTLAVVYAWYMTAWGANWLAPDRLAVRVLLVGLMFASLIMSVAIADAFDGRAWLFVTGYLLLQLGRSAFLILALRGRALGEHFVKDFVWELLTGVLWVAGAIADGDARLVLWGDRRRREPRRRVGAPLAAGPWPGDRSQAHRDRGRASDRALPAVLHHPAGRRARDRPSRGRRHARLRDPHVRRARALPARPGLLPARGARAPPALARAGTRGARDPRDRHRAARADRRNRRGDRRARRGRGRRYADNGSCGQRRASVKSSFRSAGGSDAAHRGRERRNGGFNR